MPRLGWKVAAASAAGSAYRVAGLACQDWVDVRLVPGPQEASLIAIASDGCGDANSGGEGARIASTVLKTLMTEYLKRGRRVAGLKRPVVLRWTIGLSPLWRLERWKTTSPSMTTPARCSA
jgi:hypothetical protein